MSQLPGNPHAANAADSMSYARIAGIPGDSEAQYLLQEAQTEATLALAYEQRTANLIALQAIRITTARANEIQQRLGATK